MRRAAAAALIFALGCGRTHETAKADPAARGPGPRGPSPTSGPAPVEKVAARCVKGENTELRLSGVATEAVEGITKAEIDDALCPKLTVARTCLGKLVRPEHAFEATLEAKLTAGPDGELTVILEGGTLRDEAMRACVRDALLSTKLPQGPGEGRYSLRVLVSR